MSKTIAKLDEKHIINMRGKDFVLYSGLLDLAHKMGLVRLEVEPIQYPTTDNGMEAICKAVGETKDGAIFIDIGDANPKNTNKMIAVHLLRMASTRAKARALRDLTNIGMTALEELADIDDVVTGTAKPAKTTRKCTTAKQQTKSEPAAKSKPEPAKKAAAKSGNDKSNGSGKSDDKTIPRMSDAQRRAVLNLARRRQISEDELANMTNEQFGVPVENLSSSDAAQFIRQLQQAA